MLKILMLATSMEYGGGETHILELSKYLKSNGTEIKIMSNGNEFFEKEIADAGIAHIFAPFHSRNIFDMRKSGKILKDTIKSYNPDVVHAHSRIPAFIASGVCKKFKIPLVTTMHGTFKQSLMTKIATNWGDYSLYVSEDIKTYWQKYYKLKNGYMFKTVNGVDTDLFNGEINPVGTPYMASVIGHDANGHDISCPYDIRQEFNIKPEEKIILSISRLEERGGFNLAYSALKLCEIAEEIYNQDKNTRIIIVGDGDMFAEIKDKAGKINAKLGFEYIIMTGRRNDAYNFCKSCDVAVGLSRFALEALACAKPVIMCGDMGYLGRFTKENSDKCEATNFTCRGFDEPENINKVLSDEILFCLSGEGQEDANFAAELIREKYSVKKMAADAYSVYRQAVLKYKDYDFVLSGYYGAGNIGDDALLFTVISNIIQEKNALKICLFTKNPGKIQNHLDEYFCNITAKRNFNFWEIKNAIKKSKALVFGGGSLLQDSTSGRSFWYYSWLLKTAQKLGKKTILYSNGIGPLYSEGNQKKAAQIVNNITMATMRDEESYNYLLNMGAKNEQSSLRNKIYLTSDEALTIKNNKYLNPYKKDFKEYLNNSDYIVVSVRKWKYSDVSFFGKFAAAIDIICRENNLIPVYLVMQPSNDKRISEYLTQLNGRAYCPDINGDIEKTLSIIRSAKAVISMRLHTLIFAAAFSVPMIGVAYDPKVKNFLSAIFDNDGYTVELKDFSKDKLTEKFKILMSNHEDAKNKINESAEKLIKKASSNAGLFLKAMDFEHE